MKYTVQQLATLAGVSVRTLHYYDEIGLLKPAFVHQNGYRYYQADQLTQLQQILFFRELDFSLERIKEIMQSPSYDSLAALVDQKKLLELKKERLENLLQIISETISSLKGGENMTDDKKFSAFNDPTYQKYKDEVQARWGTTEAYKQSMERVGKLSSEELKRIQAEGEDIARTAVELMEKGFAANSPEVQKQIGRFYQHLHNFYDPSYELFKGLGQMYVDDPRFMKVYEDRAKGFASFMRDAMVHYAEANLSAEQRKT